MWYLKEAAKKVTSVTTSAFNYSKSYILPQKTVNQKLLDQTLESKQQIVSTVNLDKLVEASYTIQSFDELSLLIYNKLRIFTYGHQAAKKTLNLLIIVNYLLKHGPSGFIDQFRNSMKIFTNYKQLEKKIIYKSPFDQQYQKEFQQIIDKIKSRASHIQILLSDKVKLQKQRDLAMLIKQKLRVYQKKKLEQNAQILKNLEKPSQQNTFAEKKQLTLHDYFQNYFWKYVGDIDTKLEGLSENIMKKVDSIIKHKQRKQQQSEDLEIKLARQFQISSPENKKKQESKINQQEIIMEKQKKQNEVKQNEQKKISNQNFLDELEKQTLEVKVNQADLLNLQKNLKDFNIDDNICLL